MFYYKKGNSTFALKDEPTITVVKEAEVEVADRVTKEKKLVKRNVRTKVFDDSYTPITKDEFDALNKARLHK